MNKCNSKIWRITGTTNCSQPLAAGFALTTSCDQTNVTNLQKLLIVTLKESTETLSDKRKESIETVSDKHKYLVQAWCIQMMTNCASVNSLIWAIWSLPTFTNGCQIDCRTNFYFPTLDPRILKMERIYFIFGQNRTSSDDKHVNFRNVLNQITRLISLTMNPLYDFLICIEIPEKN